MILWLTSPVARWRCPLTVPRSSQQLFQRRRRHAAAPNAEGKDANGVYRDNSQSSWQETVTASYLQRGMDDFCLALEEVLEDNGDATGDTEHADDAGVWRAIRREAEADAATEPLLSSFLYASILSHDTFERSLAFVLANRLSDATLLSTELFEVFHQVLKNNKHVSQAALADISAVRERDPSCRQFSQALLYFKGFHSIQVHRIAHELWQSGRKVMALALQSRMSEVFAVDIHPAARVGKGVLLDHGTGVVIGETAVVGNFVSILQNVTLGGTGKEHGDRHPKIGDNVLIGASATILGNIQIGQGAQVAAGSLVRKPVPPGTMVAGSPAREVGHVIGNPAQKMDQWVKDGSAEAEPPQQQTKAAAAAAPAAANGIAPSAPNKPAWPVAAAAGAVRGTDPQRPQSPDHIRKGHRPQQQPPAVAAGPATGTAGMPGSSAAGPASKAKPAGKPKPDPEYFI